MSTMLAVIITSFPKIIVGGIAGGFLLAIVGLVLNKTKFDDNRQPLVLFTLFLVTTILVNLPVVGDFMIGLSFLAGLVCGLSWWLKSRKRKRAALKEKGLDGKEVGSESEA